MATLEDTQRLKSRKPQWKKSNEANPKNFKFR